MVRRAAAPWPERAITLGWIVGLSAVLLASCSGTAERPFGSTFAEYSDGKKHLKIADGKERTGVAFSGNLETGAFRFSADESGGMSDVLTSQQRSIDRLTGLVEGLVPLVAGRLARPSDDDHPAPTPGLDTGEAPGREDSSFGGDVVTPRFWRLEVLQSPEPLPLLLVSG